MKVQYLLFSPGHNDHSVIIAINTCHIKQKVWHCFWLQGWTPIYTVEFYHYDLVTKSVLLGRIIKTSLHYGWCSILGSRIIKTSVHCD